jgi:GT2 family glycosyltransferase
MLGPRSVTVIVTPRERYSIARRTFESVAANTPGDQHFVYVAGGAPPDFQRFLQDGCRRPNYELIVAPEFLAPNVARNLGLARADTEYVAFLENDVVVEPGWLDALVRCAEEEAADLVSPLCLIGEPSDLNLHNLGGKLLIEDRGGQIWMRERHYYGQINLRGMLERLTRRPTDYSEFHCALVRRSVFERIGLLDETIGGSAEHIDLGMHLRALGCRGFAEPTAVVSHLAIGYTLGDLELYRLRWSSQWRSESMAHFARKWGLTPDSGMLSDYRSDFLQKRERCLLRLDELRAAPPVSADNLQVAQEIVQLLDQMEALGYQKDLVAKVRDAHSFASQLFPAAFRVSSRPFLAHYVGMGSILAAYGANSIVIAAALLSGAYVHGEFPPGFDKDVVAMRRWLRRRVGKRIEMLLFEYSCLEPQSLAPFRDNLDTMPVELANAVVMKMAEEIEHRAAGDHRHVGSPVWLHHGNRLIDLWMPSLQAIADRAGFGSMPTVLRETCETAKPGSADLSPVRRLNFAVEAIGGVRRSPVPRKIAETDRHESPVPTGGKRLAIDLDGLKASNGGVAIREATRVRIDAALPPWTYSAYLRLSDIVNGSGPAVVEIRLQTDQGEMGALVLERGSSVYAAAQEQSLAVGTDPVTLRFAIPAIEEVGDLVFRGWPHDDGAAKARIFEIGIVSVGTAPRHDRGTRPRFAALAGLLRRLRRR